MHKLKIILAALTFMFAASVLASHQDKSTIKDRTAPTGKVYQTGDDVPAPVAPVVVVSGPRSGEQVYSTKCAMCHAAGIAGAPKTGDPAAWIDRIAQGEATLFEHAINGFKGMPAKGGCTDCSDDETKAAVSHMLGLSQ